MNGKARCLLVLAVADDDTLRVPNAEFRAFYEKLKDGARIVPRREKVNA